jgi:hypothetical protein
VSSMSGMYDGFFLTRFGTGYRVGVGLVDWMDLICQRLALVVYSTYLKSKTLLPKFQQ